MRVAISLDGAGSTADEMYSLRQWLVDEDELRGNVRMVVAPPPEGTLGSLPQELLVMLAPGGAATVLAGAAIAWMRHRASDLSMKITRADGSSIEFTTTHLRGLTTDKLSEEIARFAGTLDSQLRGDGQQDSDDGNSG